MSMKVATIGLMAISVARATLFEDFEEFNDEGFGLTEEFDEGRALQQFENEEDRGNGEEIIEEASEDDSNKKRNKRGGRGRGRGRQNRRGKKGCKKGKGQGYFNLEKFEAKLASRLSKMGQKSEKKCENQAKFQAAVCGQAEDNEDCTLWAEAMQKTCLSLSECRVDLAKRQGRCNGAHKAMLSSFSKDDKPLMEGLGTSTLIGDCFRETLDAASTCFAGSKKATETSLTGINVPSEETIAQVRAQLKAMRKAGRKNNRRGRKNGRGQNERNRRQQNKKMRNKRQDKRSNKKWDQGGVLRWEKRAQLHEEFNSDDDDV